MGLEFEIREKRIGSGSRDKKKPVLRIRDVYHRSRILIFTHPGSRISDPGSKNSNKREGWKKICSFYVATNFTKLHITLVLMCWRKKIWAYFQRIIELFTQKIVNKLSKIWIWDPGSEIWDPEKTYSGSQIPDPGVEKAPDPGSWIWIRNIGQHKPLKGGRGSRFQLPLKDNIGAVGWWVRKG